MTANGQHHFPAENLGRQYNFCADNLGLTKNATGPKGAE